MRLQGRQGAVTLLHTLSQRDVTSGPGRPVLLLTGPRGSGKTAFLEGIGEYLDGRLPYARVDFDGLQKDTVCDVLNMISIDFNKHGAPYGRLAFPRLVLGQIAMADPKLNAVRSTARQELQTRFEEYRNIPKLRTFIQNLMPAQMPVTPEQVNAVLGVVLIGLRSWRLSHAVVTGPGTTWYGHQDRGLHHDPLETLIDLNSWAHDRDAAGNGEQADELMLSAFLADLGAAFRRRRRLRGAGYRCIILLDNADTRAGRGFLDALVAAGGDQGTIMVTATSRGPLATDVAGSNQVLPTTETSDVESRPEGRDGARRPWFPVRLADLTLTHVHELVRDMALRGCNTRHAEMAVHGFTHGHAGATSLLLTAIAQQPADPIDLRRVLERRSLTASGPQTYWELLRVLLLGDLPDAETDLLATCAAARDMAQAVQMAGKDPLAATRVEQITDAEVWVPGTTNGSLVMHPVVRRLLLQRLVERDLGAADGWTTVHRWLRDHAARNDDATGALHHALALGEVEYVTEEMTRRFHDPAGTTRTWLRDLKAVVAAPCCARVEGPALDHVNRLKRWAGFQPTITHSVAMLVAGQWVANEPLIDSRRAGLYKQIQNAFSGLSGNCNNDSEPLTTEATRYGALATRWS